MIIPVLSFYTSVYAQYGVAPNQLHLNSIRYMTGFYLVCMWMGVEPTDRRFQSCFLSRNTNPFCFYLSARSKEKNATFLGYVLEKVSAWESSYIFVEEPVDCPFNFPHWDEAFAAPSGFLYLEPWFPDNQFERIFFQGFFQPGANLCSWSPARFLGVPSHLLLAGDLDLGKFLVFFPCPSCF